MSYFSIFPMFEETKIEGPHGSIDHIFKVLTSSQIHLAFSRQHASSLLFLVGGVSSLK
jgi:hypothetical protein